MGVFFDQPTPTPTLPLSGGGRRKCAARFCEPQHRGWVAGTSLVWEGRMKLRIKNHRADPRLVWLATVLAAATFVVFLAQQA